MKHRGDGTNGRDDETGHAQVTTAETTNPTESRGHAGGVSEVHDDGGGPAARDPAHVHIDPDGDTHAEQNGSVALERADAGIDGEVGRVPHDVQDEVKRSATRREMPIEGERGSALARRRSTTRADENDQHDETNLDNVPEHPPEPLPPPDRPVNASSVPQSFELEGERSRYTSFDVGPTTADAHTTGVPRRHEDARDVWKKLGKTSEHVSKWSESRVRENSPKEARVEPEAPKRDATRRHDAHSIKECP
ncbi:hypothetical protein V8E55_003875 [Tylopilus felleus]